MTVTAITDHSQAAIDRLLSQFNDLDQPNIEGLVEIFTTQVQELETVNTQLVTLRLLEYATGEQLDNFGELVGQTRGGRGDEFYRIVLAGKIGVNNSEGTVEELISTFTTYSQISNFQYSPYYPAACQIITDQIPIFDVELITDSDMEASGTAAWAPVNSATVTKSVVAPYEGTQSLRIAYNAVNNPAAVQNFLEAGQWYWAKGRVKMENAGTKVPTIWNGGAVLWQGVPFTSWYEFDVIFEATAGTLSFGADFTSAEWIEYDIVSVKKVKKFYAAEIFDICQRVIPAGVELIRIAFYDGDDAFAFQGGPLGLGFGDVADPTVGGKLASLL